MVKNRLCDKCGGVIQPKVDYFKVNKHGWQGKRIKILPYREICGVCAVNIFAPNNLHVGREIEPIMDWEEEAW